MWTLSTNRALPQGDQRSFVGGTPQLPNEVGIPECKLCNQSMTFLFQIAFPTGSVWEGKTMAFFFCTRCVEKDFLIPEMLNGQLKDADIPARFLIEYQRNFSFIVFETENARPVEGYDELVVFSEINMLAGSRIGDFGKLGGTPEWVLGDEAPATYESSHEMAFLFQLAPDFEFTKTDGAPPQVRLNLFRKPSPSPFDYYELFLGNTVYAYATKTGQPLLYVVTQVD